MVFYRGGGGNWSDCHKLGVVVRNDTLGSGCSGPRKPNKDCGKNVNGYPGCTVVGLARADHWAGPYSIVGGPAIPFQQEDFYMYRTKRGFHAVFHGRFEDDDGCEGAILKG